MAATFLQLPLASSIFFRLNNHNQCHSFFTATTSTSSAPKLFLCSSRRNSKSGVVLVGKEETELRVSEENEQEEDEEPTPEDLEYTGQIKRVLELLRKNRDMLFSEVSIPLLTCSVYEL